MHNGSIELKVCKFYAYGLRIGGGAKKTSPNAIPYNANILSPDPHLIPNIHQVI